VVRAQCPPHDHDATLEDAPHLVHVAIAAAAHALDELKHLGRVLGAGRFCAALLLL
jgi:prephenate dehydrogenase